jgi:RNA 3'-terminal phosphate cyclase (ATP)
MITIDGSHGEGGGQVLRTALGLSVVTGRPFRITDIRAARARPGLLRQHLTCVRAAAAFGRAEVEGDTLGSRALVFRPTGNVGGEHTFAVGTAGSVLLVFQAVLPALLVADAPTRLVLEGGTHNPLAPPYDFVEKAFVPVLTRMGAKVRLTLERPGFAPAGGGRLVVEVDPVPLAPLDLRERGAVRTITGRAIVSAVPIGVAHRELNVLREAFALPRERLVAEEVPRPFGPGNVVLIEVECDTVTEVFAAFGEQRVPAEQVAARAVGDARRWLAHGAPVGEHLADQLLLPLALAGGRFRTGPLSVHATTNLEGVRAFVDRPFGAVAVGDGVWEVGAG